MELFGFLPFGCVALGTECVALGTECVALGTECVSVCATCEEVALVELKQLVLHDSIYCQSKYLVENDHHSFEQHHEHVESEQNHQHSILSSKSCKNAWYYVETEAKCTSVYWHADRVR